MYRVDLCESFQMSIYVQNLASIQPRTSAVKFAQKLLEPSQLHFEVSCPRIDTDCKITPAEFHPKVYTSGQSWLRFMLGVWGPQN